MSFDYFYWGQDDEGGIGHGPEAPPGSPPTRRFEGPWLQQQLTISLVIGLSSFLLFCVLRRRFPVVFAPRTKLKGFSPHDAHIDDSFLGWIMPTLRTSEFTVLQIVGLDAAVLLSFLKMSFYYFVILSAWGCIVLMPVNWWAIGSIDGTPDEPRNGTTPSDPDHNSTFTSSFDFALSDYFDLDLEIAPTTVLTTSHLVSAYIISLLALRFLYTTYVQFVRSRQLFSLELVHSIPARTVLLENLPNHLRGERALAEYFEALDMRVESTSVVRETGSLGAALDRRTKLLNRLERAWVRWLGNPSSVEAYDPDNAERFGGIQTVPEEDGPDVENGNTPLIVPNRKRPIRRIGFKGKKVDEIDYLTVLFKEADENVKRLRRSKFRATHVGFVTFEDAASAQIAAQVVHYPVHNAALTCLAPEPRDIVWANVSLSPGALMARKVLVSLFMIFLLLFWGVPVTFLASFLSYEAIRKNVPALAGWIEENPRLRALVQNSLPSIVLIGFNALLPALLEGASYLQGLKARSWIEYSLFKKYFLFLIVNVVGIFIVASTAWSILADLAGSPIKLLDKLAQSLPGARHFFLSYVVLQSVAIMPLQLLQLSTILPRAWSSLFAKTPRDYAELNAPPTLVIGTVYPQALLIFVISILYSVVSPLICVFGALYFAMAYLVYKYKLLFMYYRPFESRGQAWPLSANRCLLGVVLFQLFMTSLFSVRKTFVATVLMVPLIAFTVYFGYLMTRSFRGLSKYVNLSSIKEVQRGGENEEIMRLREGHPVSASQSNLSRRRYAAQDETLYVAQEDDKTDYKEPPQSGYFRGVLNTGRRRYGHPALTGILPSVWLPVKKEKVRNGKDSAPKNQPIVLTLRRRHSSMRNRRISSIVRPTEPSQRTSVGPLVDVGVEPYEDHTSVWASSEVPNNEGEATASNDVPASGSVTDLGAVPSSPASSRHTALISSPLRQRFSGVSTTAMQQPPASASSYSYEGPSAVPFPTGDAEEGGEGEGGESDEEEDDEAEGVYIHRPPTGRSRHVPGAFPGFADEDE